MTPVAKNTRQPLSFLIAFMMLFTAVFLCFGKSTAQAQAQAQDHTPKQQKIMENNRQLLSELVSIKEKIKFCAEISKDRGLRINCYDRISESLGYIAEADRAKTEKTIAQLGFWNVVERENKIGEMVTYLKLDSKNTVRNKRGITRAPTLILRCKDKVTDVYLDWGEPLGNPNGRKKNIYIEYQIDSSASKPQEWDYSLDFFSAFNPTSVDFVRELRGKEKLIMKFTPDKQSMKTLLFELKGFNSALSILVDRCYK